MVLKMSKNYSINQVVKTLTIDVNKKMDDQTGVHFEFLVNILRSSDGKYSVQVFRNEIYELKPISGDLSHDDVFVRDLFLVDDRIKFSTEYDALNYISKRLDELFG